MSKEVVKIQRPLAGNAEPMVYVYNKDRSYRTFVPYTDELRKQLGDDVKQFWLAEIGNGAAKLLEQVEDPGW